MRNPKSPFHRHRNPSTSSTASVGQRTPEYYLSYPKSPSAYSSPNHYNDKSTSTPKKNPVKIAARSVAGAFAACFTPPEEEEKKSSSSFDDSELYKPPPSDGSSGSSEKTRRASRSIYASSNSSTRVKEVGNVKFTMAEIYKATRNFSPSLKIGQGGFGTVYKVQLKDGTLVAVKRAKKIMHDKHKGHEFQSEVQTLAQVEHLNLVRLYGFLEHEDERILVVEYVPNGNLREHLDGERGNVPDLAARLDIATDVAHAVTYLHTYTDHPIIHRDIKSSNILLTENLRAKVADFGFARLVGDSEADATHISTQVKGTAGYLDPEYLRTYQLTEKSDVYSFGILLVELVSGRRPIETKRDVKERVTARWAIRKFAEGDAISTLDPRLERSAANNWALEKIFELALQCLAPHRNHRPPMQKCAEVLWSIRKDYRELAASDMPSLFSSSQKGILIREEYPMLTMK